jgi:hypothetical protein
MFFFLFLIEIPGYHIHTENYRFVMSYYRYRLRIDSSYRKRVIRFKFYSSKSFIL